MGPWLRPQGKSGDATDITLAGDVYDRATGRAAAASNAAKVEEGGGVCGVLSYRLSTAGRAEWNEGRAAVHYRRPTRGLYSRVNTTSKARIMVKS